MIEGEGKGRQAQGKHRYNNIKQIKEKKSTQDKPENVCARQKSVKSC